MSCAAMHLRHMLACVELLAFSSPGHSVRTRARRARIQIPAREHALLSKNRTLLVTKYD
jgi:hypothetical protein